MEVKDLGAKQIPEALRRTRAVAILRGGSGEHLDDVLDALVDSGVRCLEVTTNTPRALEALRAARLRHGTAAELGVGTVRTPEQVDQAAEAGAQFIVTPGLDEAVADRVRAHDLAYFPGAFTATEVLRAHALGATAVKIFPASLGGPKYVRELRAPLDDVEMLPTGGISPDTAGDFLRAGACAVGVGGPLLGDALDTGDLDGLRSRARALLDATGGAA
ncbi:bifunctional 4-hydroxy-2-oxoglutarate aldolase/2-dehydro-3-deoxy-phosphogluconate aldolase [Saccharopolyspora sp. HNM0983]|uniref:Bifunctional 4-hydroxy-2-oxoglutarate aldolase/2-dehydro-3-deoxy-phosphogluconate aldolase n=1 Tax=Saccharopolyspora montiporae TaxID=2781240 RepID=A0A929B674_9PSEU|nr:bifunctional 4-hydroxy-2-oxoglutarate aldolase/2-dehydro-3-deoxy-phosphogluconate aldolase [Saccharopolyspora sp. HNM0983]MBE9373952.1 bifunctional 4-hydroxy-2-oxoglutarate aldolase/2-dehydro-3-deoxy-phosphogluconate aldolase [Saccharopolyspora sp. HNM0983]